MLKGETARKTRIGKISYINCLPFYHNLEVENAKEEFYETYPSKLNEALRESNIDFGPVSSLEYLNNQKQYLLLRDFAIGSRDFSGSVILFSKNKIEELNGRPIAISQQSLSSATLLQVLMRFKFKYQNEFVTTDLPPENILDNHTAALLIGDDALFYQSEEFIYKYDLSELWWNWTGKPFCFCVWAVRRDYASLHPLELSNFLVRMRKNLNRNLVDIETLVKDAMGLSFLDAKFPKIFGYLFNLNFTLDEAMIEGLELFYRLAARLGVSPRAEPLDFFKETSV